MKKFCITFLIAMSFLTVFPASSFATDNKPILIGNLSGFSGTYSALAKMQKDGVDMAVNEINSAGGLLGRRIEVIHEDTEVNPAVGSRKIERLIMQKKVDFCVGAISSGVTLAMMEIVKKHNKILMVTISQSPKITGEKKNKNTFRVNSTPSITSGALCKYMTSNLGEKYYLLTVDYAWGRSTSAQFHKNLKEMGANIIGETWFPLGNKDFASYFGKIKAAKPDVLVITAAGNDAISVVTQADRYGINKAMTICGDGSLISGVIINAMGDAANGIISSDYYSATLDTPENKEWAAKYKKLYENANPSKVSVSSYEAVMWLAQAVKKAESIETEKVIAALEGSTYHGPQGIKTMDPESHQTSLEVYMIKVEHGQRKIFDKVK